MKKIIAFVGRKRSGKGVLSNVVKQNTPNSVIITIASYLKNLCCDILNIDYDTLNKRKDNGYVFSIKPTERWFNIINKRTNISVDDIKKEISDIEFTTIRQMLQVIGTNLIRKYNPRWHVNCMMSDINSYDDNYTIIIDDVRFPNEYNAIKSIGGIVFFIVRSNYFDVSNHISETSLKWQDFKDDFVIINDIPQDMLEEYFRISYLMDFKKNNQNPIYLSSNLNFKLDCNVNFPNLNTKSILLKELIEQNKNNVRFLKNGIIQYTASNREQALNFNTMVLNSNCQSWKRNYVIYNPLINENLKMFL